MIKCMTHQTSIFMEHDNLHRGYNGWNYSQILPVDIMDCEVLIYF